MVKINKIYVKLKKSFRKAFEFTVEKFDPRHLVEQFSFVERILSSANSQFLSECRRVKIALRFFPQPQACVSVSSKEFFARGHLEFQS